MNLLLVDELLRRALIEDIGSGDVTAELVPEAPRPIRATMVAKDTGILCGGGIAARCFALIDPAVQVQLRIEEGEEIEPGDEIGTVSGRAASILSAERVALNFVQRLSGIASFARSLAQRAAPFGIRIVETRKTTPGLRMIEKYAVKCGSGFNHRFDLASAVMLKDNHFAASGMKPGQLLAEVRRRSGHTQRIICEATTPQMAGELAAGGADIVLLDNMTPEQVRDSVAAIAARSIVEVSGGVNSANLDSYLIPGVHVISIGALTHSFRALDISLEM
jgi:nicotinate-nucleotide pyrophosphorylase (carboxylating)